jgi:hemerythrin-like domain-containing protein
VAQLGSMIRNPFSFLFARSSKEEQVVAYITREHRRGRRLTDILEDRYVQNRLTSQQQLRLLERPEVVKALGEQDIDAARESIVPR